MILIYNNKLAKNTYYKQKAQIQKSFLVVFIVDFKTL